ncbi:MAG: hypothetical protein KDB03_13770 [Planctomycetales bacterium]|nr:hypothetical protein [Planctomycetales bacterium]
MIFSTKLLQTVEFACLLSVVIHGPLLAQATATSEVQEFSNVQQVIENWQPNRHLFVKGRLGVGASQLEDLHTWLTANASHWVIVLMDTANGEHFSAPDGRSYSGMDAVEYALGYGLSNLTDFGRLTNPVTAEADGAVFVLFLKERKFSYFASEAQDRRNLGEAQWVGKLDQPAFRAMRSGGRIIDAVKDTVRNVNDRLAAAIKAEVNAAQRAAQEKERALAALRQDIEHAVALQEDVKLAAAEFRRIQQTESGELAVPPIDVWRDELNIIRANLDSLQLVQSRQRLAKLENEMASYLNAYAAVQGMDERIEELQHSIANLERSPARVAAVEIKSIRDAIEQAQRDARSGTRNVGQILAAADSTVIAGRRKLEREQVELEQAALIRSWIRWTMMLVLFGLLSLLALVLLILNLRRRRIMLSAIEQLRSREAQARTETDGIDKLLTRSEELLGNKEMLAARGYTGKTREVSSNALEFVDDLFIMSRQINQVLKDAQRLVEPNHLAGRFWNLFSGGNYHDAIELTSVKPLRFSYETGLPIVLKQIQGTTPEITATSGSDGEIYASFEEVFAAFKRRGSEATAALDLFEQSLTTIHDQISELQSGIKTCLDLDQQLNDAAVADKLFDMTALLEQLLPSAEQDLVRADELSTFDAVSAVQEVLPNTRRKLSEARQLAQLILSQRKTTIQSLQSLSSELDKLEMPTAWILSELNLISNACDRAFESCVSESIQTETAQLDSTFNELESRGRTTLELVRRSKGDLTLALTTWIERVQEARAALSKQFNLAPAAVLAEFDQSPDTYLAAATKSLDAANLALARGLTADAQNAIDSFADSIVLVERLTNTSLEVAKTFLVKLPEVRGALQKLEARTPAVHAEIQAVADNYAASALLLRSESPPPMGEAASGIGEMCIEASKPMAAIGNWLDGALIHYQAGKLLQAAEGLQQCNDTIESSNQILTRVESHLHLLEQAVLENERQIQSLLSATKRAVEGSQHKLVTRRTMRVADTVADEVGQLASDIQHSRQHGLDPFGLSAAMLKLQNKILQLESQCQVDKQAHAEASRAVHGARRQHDLADQLVRQSQTDGIPDSRKTGQVNSIIQRLTGVVQEVETRIREEHGDWESVDADASQVQSELAKAAEELRGELQTASQALTSFQQASQSVFSAENWSGSFGIRISGSPGVHELQRARASLQNGDYQSVLQMCNYAMSVAQAAIQQAEREVARRQLAARMEAERARRQAEAARQRNASSPFGGSTFGRGSSFGSGRSIGGGSSFGGHRSSGGGGSGFSRSGW